MFSEIAVCDANGVPKLLLLKFRSCNPARAGELATPIPRTAVLVSALMATPVVCADPPLKLGEEFAPSLSVFVTLVPVIV